MARGRYYEHSGMFTLSGTLLALGLGLISGALLAAAYAYLVLYIPLGGYITFILSVGFGLLVGVASGTGLVWGRVRNRGVAAVVAGVVALFAFYVSWGVWVYALLRRAEVEEVRLLPLLVDPSGLWEVIAQINLTGAWSMSSFTPTGVVLWLLWGLEAALILLPAFLLGLTGISDPFCERCNAWATERKGIATVAGGDAEELKRRLEEKDFEHLDSLGALAADAHHWFRLDLHACERCKDLQTLSVKSVTAKVDDKGQRSESTEDVMDHLLITSSEAEALQALPERPGDAVAG